MSNKIKFKKLLTKLSTFKGTGTSMLTILIPNKKAIIDIINIINNNLNSASNIKSNNNYKNVKIISESAIEKLKNINKNNNDIALFVGIDDNNNKISIIIEPIKPIKSFLFKFGNVFFLEELFMMLNDNGNYGYIVISGS